MLFWSLLQLVAFPRHSRGRPWYKLTEGTPNMSPARIALQCVETILTARSRSGTKKRPSFFSNDTHDQLWLTSEGRCFQFKCLDSSFFFCAVQAIAIFLVRPFRWLPGSGCMFVPGFLYHHPGQELITHPSSVVILLYQGAVAEHAANITKQQISR